jgi:hypothetical protein
VLSSERREAHNWIVVPEELDADHPLLDVPTTRRIERTPEALAACAATLIRASRQIILVDPYFDPYAPRFRGVLRHLLQITCAGSREPDRLEYHLLQSPGTNPNKHLDRPRFCAGLRDIGIIPANLSVTFVRWRERQGGEQFHGRYILTERGALKFDAGLDAGEPGQTTPVNWEPPDEHARLLSWFELDAQVFDRETPSVQVSSNGYLEDID